MGGNRKLGTAPLQLQGLQRPMAPSPLDLAPLSLLRDTADLSHRFLYIHARWEEVGYFLT